MSCKPTYKGKRYNSLAGVKAQIRKEHEEQNEARYPSNTLSSTIEQKGFSVTQMNTQQSKNSTKEFIINNNIDLDILNKLYAKDSIQSKVAYDKFNNPATMVNPLDISDFVESSIATSLNSIAEIMNFNIQEVNRILELYPTLQFNQIVKDKELTADLHKNIYKITQLLSVISNIETIDEIYTPDVEEHSKLEVVNEAIANIKKLNDDYAKIKKALPKLLDRYTVDYVLNKSTNPKYDKYKEVNDTSLPFYKDLDKIEQSYIDILFENEDITSIMKYVDAINTTGVTFSDLIVKDIKTEESLIELEVNKQLAILTEKVAKAMEDKDLPFNRMKINRNEHSVAEFVKEHLVEKDENGNPVDVFVQMYDIVRYRKDREAMMIKNQRDWDEYNKWYYDMYFQIVLMMHDNVITSNEQFINSLTRNTSTSTENTSRVYEILKMFVTKDGDTEQEIKYGLKYATKSKKAILKEREDWENKHIQYVPISKEELEALNKLRDEYIKEGLDPKNVVKQAAFDQGIIIKSLLAPEYGKYVETYVREFPKYSEYGSAKYRRMYDVHEDHTLGKEVAPTSTPKDTPLTKLHQYLTAIVEEAYAPFDDMAADKGFNPYRSIKNESARRALLAYIGWSEKNKTNIYETTGLDKQNTTIIKYPTVGAYKEIKLINIPKENPKLSPHSNNTLGVKKVHEARPELVDKIKTVADMRKFNQEARAINNKADIESRDFNILKTFASFLGTTKMEGWKYKYKNKVDNELYILRNRIHVISRDRNNKVIKRNNKAQELDKRKFAATPAKGSHIEQMFTSWNDYNFYNKDFEDSRAFKVARTIKQLTSMKVMMLNVTAGIKNIANGYVSMVMTAGAKQHVDYEHLKQGISHYALEGVIDVIANANTYTNDTKVGAIIRRFANIYESQDEKGGKTTTEAGRAVNKVLAIADSMYMLNNAGEHAMQFGMLIAMMKSHRVIDGKIISLSEYTTKHIDKAKLFESIAIEDHPDYISFNEFNETMSDISKFGARKAIKRGDKFASYITWLERKGIITTAQIKEFNDLRKAREVEIKSEFEQYTTLFDSVERGTNTNLETGEIEGLLNPIQGSGVTEEDLTQFEQKVLNINQSLHGIYNKIDNSEFNRTLLGMLISQFRKWMIPNANRYYGVRAGQTIHSEYTNAEITGVYTSLWRFATIPVRDIDQELADTRSGTTVKSKPPISVRAILQLMKDYKRFIANLSVHYNLLSNTDKQNIRAVGTQSIAYGAVLLLSMLLSIPLWGDDDDDEGIISYLDNFAVYELSYISKEISEFSPFNLYFLYKRTIEYPIGSINTLNGVWNVFYEAFMWTIRNEEARHYRGGYNYGKSKLGVAFKKSIPLYNQLYKMENIPAYVKYFQLDNTLNTFKFN